MSDSSSTTDERVADASPVEAKPRRTAIGKTLFVVNGIVCCLLIAACMAFGSRVWNNSDNSEDSRPLSKSYRTLITLLR